MKCYKCLAFGLVFALAACSGATAATPTTGVIEITASVGTVEPVVVTPFPPDYTPPPTNLPPTLTPIPPISGALGPTELKYRVLDQFPDLFFCDPDYYPIARQDELDAARQRFPELQANQEEFNTILNRNNLAGLTTFTDDQKLLIYREHKKLAAIQFQLVNGGYQFQLLVAQTEGEGEIVTGLIDGQGVISNVQKTPAFATCPICLALDTLIETPTGLIAVQDLRVGALVWTVNQAGARVALPLIRVSKTVVPATHQVVHLVLNDGRELWVSPGHPTLDGRLVGHLEVGGILDGALILTAERVQYAGAATYDLLPAGDTGYYWANGILLASTLKGETGLYPNDRD